MSDIENNTQIYNCNHCTVKVLSHDTKQNGCREYEYDVCVDIACYVNSRIEDYFTLICFFPQIYIILHT